VLCVLVQVKPCLDQQVNRFTLMCVLLKVEDKIELPSGRRRGHVSVGVSERDAELDDFETRHVLPESLIDSLVGCMVSKACELRVLKQSKNGVSCTGLSTYK